MGKLKEKLIEVTEELELEYNQTHGSFGNEKERDEFVLNALNVIFGMAGAMPINHQNKEKTDGNENES